MLTVIAILLLLTAPLVMVVLRLVQRYRPMRSAFAYYWLTALAGSLAAWLLILLARPHQSAVVPLANWRPLTYFPDSPAFLVDSISWSFALALATLALAVILTVPMRQQESNWQAWASSLALTGFGVAAVLAANPITLMLAWAAIDLIEIAILLVQVGESQVHVQTLTAFTARIGGLGLLVWADVAARSAGNPISFLQNTSAPSGYLSLFLLVAGGLRLGVLPLHLPYLHEPRLRRGLGTTLRLVPAAASLVLLVRTAYTGVPEAWRPYLLMLVGLSALYGAILWFSSPDELSGRPFWILGMTAFVVASAACGAPEAGQAWGLASIFSGGLIFLLSTRHRNILPLPLFGLLGFIGLPFTPAWAGIQLYSALPGVWLIPVFIAAHVLLICGYVRHSIRPEPMPEHTQRWIWLLYPIGLIILPILHMVLFTSVGWPIPILRSPSSLAPSVATVKGYASLPLLTWIGGLIAVGLSALLLWIWLRGSLNIKIKTRISSRFAAGLQQVFSFRWFYNFIGLLLRFSVRSTRRITDVLEGEGGILWVLVLLALLVAMLLRGGSM